jgi:hypothetical protein
MMYKILPVVLVGTVLLSLTRFSAIKTNTIGEGQQPQIGLDNKGFIRVVYGLKDEIFCATSADKGLTFERPVLVAKLPGMHLGMSRGPQIASSDKCSIITAMDKAGNIHWFRLNNSANEWNDMGIVNDLKGSAPEGLMGLAADKKDNFYAVWLDTRTGGHNQVYFSSLSAKASQWSKNSLIYRSPDGHVCECCKPNIAVQGAEAAVMFRNWLNGARDLYVMKSFDAGKTFTAAQKLGNDTWKLNGCPMDGGGIVIDHSNIIRTAWQRKGIIYYDEPGKPEVFISNGRNCSISGTGPGAFISYNDKDTVKLTSLKGRRAIAAGKGDFLKSTILPDRKIFCVWEQDDKIKFRTI